MIMIRLQQNVEGLQISEISDFPTSFSFENAQNASVTFYPPDSNLSANTKEDSEGFLNLKNMKVWIWLETFLVQSRIKRERYIKLIQATSMHQSWRLHPNRSCNKNCIFVHGWNIKILLLTDRIIEYVFF